MSSAWIGFIGVIIGSIFSIAASFGATWLQYHYQGKAKKQADESAVKTLILKGAYNLKKNLDTAISMVPEIKEFRR